ncbi:chondroitin AC/alginate lyase [Sporodiniella umbellata]|nr:chondroitin AC/alginate lyase [Sporodiniella umbellata]
MNAHQALNYWLDHDFQEADCLDKGGKKKSKCVCGTPGLWNKNWFDQEIGVPRLMGGICLALVESLSTEQLTGCRKIMRRAYERVLRPKPNLTGANLLDVASIGISLGLLDRNGVLLTEALSIFYAGVYENKKPLKDGIQPDGSFMQHVGILYNGNYGKDYINNLVSVFIETKNTGLMPPVDVQRLFEKLLEGSEWMMIADTQTSRLLWQYSAIGRMISFRYSDKQASGGIGMDLDAILEGTEGWEASGRIRKSIERLQGPVKGVNQGNLVGTRYFFNADYMVHRTPKAIVTLKMYSNRTSNSECVNAQNTFGSHLSDGTIFHYLTGDEYRDVFGAWAWDLLPGITTAPGQKAPACNKLKTQGSQSFVGGVTRENTGVAVLDYKKGTVGFKKTVFFFPSAYAVQMVPEGASTVTVLDQRRAQGQTMMYVDGERAAGSMTRSMQTLWYDHLGYSFPQPRLVHVASGEKRSDWALIGISKGQEEVDLWTAYVEDNGMPLTQYVVQPGIEAADFQSQNATLPIALDYQLSEPQVHAAYSAQDDTIGLAFWTPGIYPLLSWKTYSLHAHQPCVLLLTHTQHQLYITVTDPTQTLAQVQLDLLFPTVSHSLLFDLPVGGQSVTQTVSLSPEK